MKNDIEYLKRVDSKIREAIENIARKAAGKYNSDYNDLYQECWVAYLEFWEHFQHTALNRIRDRATDYGKKAIRVSNKTSTMSDVMAHNPGFDMEGSDYSYGEKAKLILSELPDREREIMEMYFVDSYTQEEISKKLNIPQQTVSNIISRSLQKLKS